MFRRTLGVLFSVLLLAHAAAAGTDWRVTRTDHFIIYYASGSDAVAAKTRISAEKWYSDLSGKLGFSPGGVTPVYLYPDRVSFAQAAGVKPADTVVGLAQARLIRVDASGVFADVESVLAHEMAHVFIARRLYGNTTHLPLWVNEGLAQYLSGEWSEADQELLVEAVSDGAILPLSSITMSFPTDKRGRGIAYAESYSIVQYIADKYTPQSLRDLLTETKQGRRFEVACLYSLGTKPDALETEWRDFLWQKYGMQRWFKLGAAIIWAAMALFAILAFRSRIAQKRRKAQQFEEERKSPWRDADMGDQ